MGSVGARRAQFNITSAQRRYEESHRNADREHIGFFDVNGNLLFEASGAYDSVEFEVSGPFNHNVEQRIWNNEEVNYTHNHPYESIFSPDDVRSFEGVEAHSMTATTPSGINFRLIREQGITEHVYQYNPKTDEFVNIGFTPKKIALSYEKEYDKVYLDRYLSLRKQLRSGEISRAEYEKQDTRLIKDTTKHMVTWLRSNASKYGYRFIEEK